MLIKSFFIFSLIIVAKVLCATELPTTPFLQNYPKSVYNAGTQNWQALQAANDVMYFANNYGVLRFDGNSWQLETVKNQSVVRSICEIGEDSIMVGAYGEFGVIKTNEYGQMTYYSWVNKLPEQYRSFHEVWRIYILGTRIFIQTFEHVYVFNKGEFEKLYSPKNAYKFMFKHNDQILVQDLGVGVFLYENGNLIHQPHFDFYNDKEIWAILTLTDEKTIIGTQLHGLFISDGHRNYEWNTTANDFIKKNNLFSAIRMSNGDFAFGSIQNGFILTNNDGVILTAVNSTIGLQNNTVLSLFEDKNQNLWLGLDNGIDYALTNSPLYIVKKIGGFGMGYSSIIFEDRLYAGTNQGLYYMPYKKGANKSRLVDFKDIASAKGQVWKMSILDDKLFVCHNFGLFTIKNNIVKKVSIKTGAWDIKKIPGTNSQYLVGAYSGFYIYNNKNGEVYKVKGFDDPARRFEFVNTNNVLVSHGYKGIYNLEIDFYNHTARIIDHFSKENALQNNYGNEIFKVREKLIAATDSGVYYYTNSTFKYSLVWDSFFLGDAGGIYTIKEASNSNVFCFKNGFMHKITWLNDEMFDVQSEQFATIANTFPRSFENILELSESQFLIGNEGGFVLYIDNIAESLQPDVNVSLSSAKFIDKTDNNQYSLPFTKENNVYKLNKISYKQNSLVLLLSLPVYTQPNNLHFRYRLNNGPWSDWKKGNDLILTDLREGEYFIDIECSVNMKDVSGFLSVRVTVEPPLHRRWYSYLFYLVLFFASTLLSSYLIKKKISYEKRKESIIQQKRMIEHRIKLKRKAELAQAELTTLRNEKLKTDIRHKSKELANTTMSIIHKNQMLQQIKDVLVKLGKNDVRYKEDKELNRLIKKINKEIDNQDNWTVFEKNFDKVHENFLQRIKEKHPELTPKDLRLAAYLRMNLSSKEIAPLLNISVRSVEISRYRLRKKINLEHDQNLTEYLISS